jgi:hypothetical protein
MSGGGLNFMGGFGKKKGRRGVKSAQRNMN